MVKKEILAQIDSYINLHKIEIIKNLRTLVEIPSVRGNASKDAPYGKTCLEALQKSLELFQLNGFTGRMSQSRKYAVAEYGKGEKIIGMYAHCDVVAADGEWLYGEPFKLTERNGFLIGRGCNDDKSGIIQMLYAAKIINELKIPIKNKMMFFIGANEEDGMDDIVDFVSSEKMPDISIVCDGDYPYNIAEKSRSCVMIESCKEFEKIKNIQGGKYYNVILDKVNVEYTDGSKMTVSGSGGHAGEPQDTENALVNFAKLALNDNKVSISDKEILKDVYMLLGDCYGKGFSITDNDTFWGELTCANGKVSINNGKIQISLDIRYGNHINGEEIVEKIKDNLKGRWNVIDSTFSAGYVIDKNPITTVLLDVYRFLSGDNQAVGIKTAGGTYSRYLKNAFSIGTVMPTLEVNPNFKSGHGEVHAPDEAMSQKGFLEAIKTLVVFVLEIDKVL